jgi:hypothetical protein
LDDFKGFKGTLTVEDDDEEEEEERWLVVRSFLRRWDAADALSSNNEDDADDDAGRLDDGFETGRVISTPLGVVRRIACGFESSNRYSSISRNVSRMY